jgi:CIC family chloride channel protein
VLSLTDERQRRLVLDSLLLGVVGAVAAQAFIFFLGASQHLFLGELAGYKMPVLPSEGGTLTETIGSHGLWLIPLVVALGGLICGLMIYIIAPDAEGHGTDTAAEAFLDRGGYIRPLITPLKTIASIVTIGAGGSAGREGPTALLAAGIGSMYGTYQKRSDDERRLLLLIGMAAGLSAVFRTPIGAAIFAIEVLYDDMEFETGALLYTILASVVAYTLNGLMVGWDPLFRVPADLGVPSGFDYVEYAILGIVGGMVGAILPLTFYTIRDTFHRLPIMPHFKPAIGGLIVGLIALELPQVLGGGYGWIQEAIDGDLTLKIMLALVFAKILTMSFTVGSGGSGGILVPSMFVGGMLGGVFASLFHQPYAAFVIVGMAAVFSGAARVPIATLFMVTEMTGGYHLLTPAALVVTLSYLIQVTLSSPFKYRTLQESQVPTRFRRDVDLLESVTVGEAMSREFDSVSPTLPLKELTAEFERTHHHGFTVLDDQGNMYGIVSLGDLEKSMLEPDYEKLTAADIATTSNIATGYPDESISEALWRMGVRRIGRLPIVERKDTRKVIGVLRRQDIVEAYEQAIANRKTTSSRLNELRETHEGNVRVIEVDITEKHPFNGKAVKDIAGDLPEDCILVSIGRNNRVIFPHGNTVFQKGDHLVTLSSAACAEVTREHLMAMNK